MYMCMYTHTQTYTHTQYANALEEYKAEKRDRKLRKGL